MDSGAIMQPNGNIREEDKVLTEIDPGFLELHRLADNDKDFILEMLSKFVRTTTEGLLIIKESLAQKDLEQIASTCHKLSSPTRHLGALKLLSKLKQIENAAEQKLKEEQLSNLLTEASIEFDKVKEHVIAHINLLA